VAAQDSAPSEAGRWLEAQWGLGFLETLGTILVHSHDARTWFLAKCKVVWIVPCQERVEAVLHSVADNRMIQKEHHLDPDG
jgi:hypothetical protein